MKKLFALALMAATTPALADEATGLGTALLIDDTPRAAFSTLEPAREGAGVTLILPDPSVPGDLRIVRATLGAPMTDAEAESAGIATFALTVPLGAPAVGFAVIDPVSDVAVTGGAVRIDVTGDGAPETLSSCLTIEGMQLQAVDDKGENVWQGYVPLGYDVEPTCP